MRLHFISGSKGGGAGTRPHHTGQKFLNVMQFLGIFEKCLCWHALLEGWRPSYENPRSTRPFRLSRSKKNLITDFKIDVLKLILIRFRHTLKTTNAAQKK